MWSALLLLAKVASMEYDQLHAIEGLVEEKTKNRASSFVDPSVIVPRRKRTALPQRSSSSGNPQNPCRRSSPSSSSSSSLAESKRRMKRPMVFSGEEEQTTQSMKKPKKFDSGASSSGSKAPRETPSWLVNVMRGMNGYAPKLIIAKNLFKTDVSRDHGRLSIPLNQIVEKDFLTATEATMIEEKCRLNTSEVDLKAVLVDPRGMTWNVVLRRWDMAKSSGNFTSTYVLISAWNAIVESNRYRIGDAIELWSFRSEGKLCFALVPPTKTSSNSGASTSAL